jgi:hypothetical protein
LILLVLDLALNFAISSSFFFCLQEVATVAAMLSVQSVWAPGERRAQNEAKDRSAPSQRQVTRGRQAGAAHRGG